MNIFRTNEADSIPNLLSGERTNEDGEKESNGALVIERSELRSGEVLHIKPQERTRGEVTVTRVATEYIGNNSDGPNGQGRNGADVDLYGVTLNEGDILRVIVTDVATPNSGNNDNDGIGVDHHIRIFGPNGRERTHSIENVLDYPAEFDGNFFIGISAKGNDKYHPNIIEYGKKREKKDGKRIIPKDNENNKGAFALALQLNPPDNQPPDALDDAVITDEDVVLNGNVLVDNGNGADFDPDGDALSVTSHTQPTNGTVVVNVDGTFTYTPNANYNGPDSFTYTVSDGNDSDTADVSIEVRDINDHPTPIQIGHQFNVDGSNPVVNVSEHFTDIDGVITSYSVTGLPAGLNINPTTGVISGTIDPNASDAEDNNDETQDYLVTVIATDDDNDSGSQTFTWTVNNVAPNAVDDGGYSTNQNTPLSIPANLGVLNNDHDGSPDSDDLTIAAFDSNSAEGGTVSVSADGAFTYIPPEGFNGEDTFNYTVNDGNGGSDTAQFTITVIQPPKVSLSISDSPFSEVGGQATVTATLDRPADQAVTIDLGFSGEAQLDIDYTPSAQTITIPAGELTGYITLTGIDDDIVEINEPVIVDIVDVNGAMKDGSPVKGIILDDSGPNPDKATLSISDAMVIEGNDGTTPMIFTVTTDKLSSRDIEATVVTSPISATPGEDYIGIDGVQKVTIPVGESSVELSIPVIGDTIAEPDELFGVIITGADIPEIPGRAMIGDRLGAGTIKNDDLPNVTLSVDMDAIAENGGQAIITASLDIPALSIFNGVPIDDVIVELEFGGEATFGTDYSADPLIITIPRGETDGINTVEITAIDDFIDEMDGEAIAVGIKSLTNANERVDQQLSITIIDDDTAGVTLVETDGNTAVTEGGNNDTYTLVLDSQPTADVTIILNPDDQLTLGQSTLTFTPDNWNVPQTVAVTAVDDVELEGDHTGLITHTLTSADPKYDALSVPDVTVAITDVYNVMFVASENRPSLSSLDAGFLAQMETEIMAIADARDASDVVTVEVVKHMGNSRLNTANANQQDLVVISESTLSSKVKGIFSDVKAGVLTWEPFLYSDLGMTGSTIGTDFDYTCHRDRLADCGIRELDITNAGQAETNGVYNAPPVEDEIVNPNPNATVPLNPHISWGLVDPDQANIIATLPGESIPDQEGDPIRATIFSYEKGSIMANGMMAPGKRMGFFAHNLDHKYTDLTDVGKALFSDAIEHMVG